MKMKKILFTSIILLFVSSIFSVSVTYAYEESPYIPEIDAINTVSRVIVFSLDAFRYDYLTRTGDAPTFEWFKSEGTVASSCQPSNPTITAVNHVSMITGNHPDKHGILGNSFFDWEDTKTYSLFTDAYDPYRDTNTGLHLLKTEPSVIHAEELGVKTAAFGWPYVDYETEYNNTAPTYVWDYDWFQANDLYSDYGISNKLADTLIDDSDIKLAFARLPAVDWTGHYDGPNSPEIKARIDTSLDPAFRNFFERLDTAGLLEETVIIISSDHGMAPVTDSDYFLEDKSFFTDAVAATGLTPYLVHDAPLEYIYFIGETNTTKVEEFGALLKGQPGIQTVYVNEENDVLDLHNAPRGINISVWLQPGRSRHFGTPYVGMHGYLNDNPTMDAIFMIAGPGIEQGHTIGEVDIIDIAPTALNFLGLAAGFETEGSILLSTMGSRTTAFSIPDLYAPEILSVSYNPTAPRQGIANVIEVKVDEYGTIAVAEAEISIDNGTVVTIDLVDIGGNNTLYGTMGDFKKNQVVTIEVTVEDGIGLTDVLGSIMFTVDAPQKTSYSLISLIASILVIPFIYRRKRNR